MRILLDECVPRRLRRALVGHVVRTVPELGWAGKKNGELLQLIVGQGFDVFLTVDQNLQFQQDLAVAPYGLITLSAASNRLVDLLPLVPAILAAVPTIRPGMAIEITA